MLVKIRNFQALRSADLEFLPGLNVIVGPSNSGKTAIYRAMEAAVFNRSGDHAITQGENQMAVRIEDDDFSLTLRRDKTRSSKVVYALNGNVLQKVGRGQPPEIAAAVRMEDIELSKSKTRLQFFPQMAYPFLLDKTPAQLYEILVHSADEESYVGVLDDMRKDHKALGLAIAEDQSLLDHLKETIFRNNRLIEHLVDIPSHMTTLDQLSKHVSAYAGLVDIIDDIVDLDAQISKLHLPSERDIHRTEKVFEIMESVGRAIRQYEEMESVLFSLSQAIQDYEQSAEEIYQYKSSLSKLTNDLVSLNLDPVEKMISEYEAHSSLHSELVKGIKDIDDLSQKTKTCTDEMDSLLALLVAVDLSLSGFKTCPLCEQPIGGTHNHG